MTLAIKRLWLAMSVLLIAGMSLVPATYASAAEEGDEETEGFHVWCQLIELSSTTAPTTIVCRENPAGEFTDYTVEITEDTAFGVNVFNTTSMDDWLNGDILNIQGEIGTQSGIVYANVIINSTMNPANYRGLNGWIDSIDEENNQMVVQWNNVLHTVNVTENTHMVVGDANPAELSDFEVGDRVRVRIIKDSDIENEARIIFALRRGPRLYQLARTRSFAAVVDELDTENDEMNVTLLYNPHLTEGDVNNLVGTEGTQLTITWDEHTKFVRRYNGETTEDELSEGDRLRIVGRVNDDGTIHARLIKNNSIWVWNVGHHVGIVESVDTNANEIIVHPQFNPDGETWTIMYDDETEFILDGEASDENGIEEGMRLRARGTANGQLHTIDAFKIALYDETAARPRLVHHFARITEILEEIEEYESDASIE